jgi:hypothetical protein
MPSPKVVSNRERGSAFVEFILCFSLIWVPLFFGTAVIGFSLIRAIQVTQVCRDAGHMYAYGTDFSQSSSQTLLSNLAVGMDLSSSGNSFIIMSTVTYIAANDCQAAGLSPNTNSCPNMNSYVFTRQVSVGNSTLGRSGSVYASIFGTPSSSIQDASGGISPTNYLTSTSARATNFQTATGITLTSGQISYVSEMFATPLQPVFWSDLSNPVVSARSFF